jgi:hypothetical protein
MPSHRVPNARDYGKHFIAFDETIPNCVWVVDGHITMPDLHGI